MSLVGRAREAAWLARAIDRPESRAVVVRGPAGSGKTALCDLALENVAAAGALTGAGKYGQGDSQPAFAPIIRALTGATDAALEQLYDPQAGAAAMVAALGPALAVLQSAGFGAGASPVEPALGPPAGRREGAARLTAAALQLVRWLMGFGSPVVLLIDDAGRAPCSTPSSPRTATPHPPSSSPNATTKPPTMNSPRAPARRCCNLDLWPTPIVLP